MITLSAANLAAGRVPLGVRLEILSRLVGRHGQFALIYDAARFSDRYSVEVRMNGGVTCTTSADCAAAAVRAAITKVYVRCWRRRRFGRPGTDGFEHAK